MTPQSDDEVATALTDLVRDYDERWSRLDFIGLSNLWERDDPKPIYVGDEYAAPLIGDDQLDRHWARVAGRLKAASELHPDSATVLIFVNQVTTSKERPDPSMASSTVKVSLTKINGQWLITKFDPV